MMDNNHQSQLTDNNPQKDPLVNHILKQINSLKVENLELKKMMSYTHAVKSGSKKMTINNSQNDYELQSIKSTYSRRSR